MRTGTGQEAPGWSNLVGKGSGRLLRHAIAHEGLRGPGSARPQRPVRPVDDGDRYEADDLAPATPSVKSGPAIPPQDEDEPPTGAAPAQESQALDRISRADLGLEFGHGH